MNKVEKDFVSEEIKIRLKNYGFDDTDTENILYQQAFRWFREKKQLGKNILQ